MHLSLEKVRTPLRGMRTRTVGSGSNSVSRRVLVVGVVSVLISYVFLPLGTPGQFRSVVNSSVDRSPNPGVTSNNAAKAAYLQLPLSFEAVPASRLTSNPGVGSGPLSGQAQNETNLQTPPTQFLTRGSGYSLLLSPDEMTLSFDRAVSEPGRTSLTPTNATTTSPFPPKPGLNSLDRDLNRGGVETMKTAPANRAADGAGAAVVRLKLLGANPAATLSGQAGLPGKTNYLLGSNPTEWQTGVPTYARVRSEGVYPGIDAVYYGNGGRFEYDFVVAPGADPSRISLSFDGPTDVKLSTQGELVLTTPLGPVVQPAPTVYQTDPTTGSKQFVTAHYRLEAAQPSSAISATSATLPASSTQSAVVRFALGDYDPSRPLVIDPVLIYFNLLGNIGSSDQLNLALDRAGFVYLTGQTISPAYPVTPGAFQTAFKGVDDVFVTKIDPTTSAIIYSTFIGGSGYDSASGIALDADGNVFLAGTTGSTDFPVTSGAFQTAFRGSRPGDGSSTDVFALKLNASGTGLIYSTYLGGTQGSENGAAIALDGGGQAYITGSTSSADFPTRNALQPALAPGGTVDAFVTKLNASGTALVWSTFLGGPGSGNPGGAPGDDLVNALALDGAGNVYVGGFTNSLAFPTTPGAFQTGVTSYGHGFVSKLSSDGSRLVYSTYLGGTSAGPGIETVRGLVVDAGGAAYAVGQTTSTGFPTTPLGLKTSVSGGTLYGFVTKLNAAGSGLVFSTYLGAGNAFEAVNGVALDRVGNIYLTGATTSPQFPLTSDAVQSAFGNGTQDAFVSELNPDGTSLLYSTFLGGGGLGGGAGIRLDAANNIYIIGFKVGNPTSSPSSSSSSSSSPTPPSTFTSTPPSAPSSRAGSIGSVGVSPDTVRGEGVGLSSGTGNNRSISTGTSTNISTSNTQAFVAKLSPNVITSGPVSPTRPRLSADLVGQLRVTPDRTALLDPTTEITYSLTLKNVGAGQARGAYIRFPIPPALSVGYASFEDNRMWVSAVVNGADVAQPYVQISLPPLNAGEVVKGKLVFRPAPTTVGAASASTDTAVASRFRVVWDDDAGSGKQTSSNGVRFNLSKVGNTNETDGAVQLFDPVVLTFDTQGHVRLSGDFYIPGETVDLWYTDPDHKSAGLGSVKADEQGRLNFEFWVSGWPTGRTYSIAGYGERSGVSGTAILSLP